MPYLQCTHSRKDIKQFAVKISNVTCVALPEEAKILSAVMIDDRIIISALVSEVDLAKQEDLEPDTRNTREFYVATNEELLPARFNREWDYKFISSVAVNGAWGNYYNPIFHIFEVGEYIVLSNKDKYL